MDEAQERLQASSAIIRRHRERPCNMQEGMRRMHRVRAYAGVPVVSGVRCAVCSMRHEEEEERAGGSAGSARRCEVAATARAGAARCRARAAARRARRWRGWISSAVSARQPSRSAKD
eukprot:7231680-Prymnesium_polylepis.2